MADAEARALTTGAPAATAAERAAMLRVDHAGEVGATRIYAGQQAVMGEHVPTRRIIDRMAAQEERHRVALEAMLRRRGVRPTLLGPFWDRAGHALGVATALISPEAAMACTAAVETEIDRHYGQQLREIGDADPELAATVADFQAEEIEHRDTAIAQGAERAPAYALLSGVIRIGCRAAIALSKRL